MEDAKKLLEESFKDIRENILFCQEIYESVSTAQENNNRSVLSKINVTVSATFDIIRHFYLTYNERETEEIISNALRQGIPFEEIQALYEKYIANIGKEGDKNERCNSENTDKHTKDSASL